MRVHWSEQAHAQVRDIFQYIVRDRPRAANRLLASLQERVELLAEFPEQGKLWGERARPDLGEILFESYRVVYRVDPGEIFILSVRHTRMQRSDNVEDVDP